MSTTNEEVDLTDFYTNIGATYAAFESITENNQKIIGEILEPIKADNLSNEEEYILSFIKYRKDLFLKLLKMMDTLNFDKVESIQPGFNSFGNESKRYSILVDIDLKTHTLNVVLFTIDYLLQAEMAQDPFEIALLLSLLHDFGKSPIIANRFSEAIGEDHEKISAHFAKQFLSEYMKKNKNPYVTNDLTQLVYNTLYKNHSISKEDANGFLKILIHVDRKTRDDELLKYKQDKKFISKVEENEI
ncbi:hypothetical protein CP985_03495 [Malaciobacter mytili LMG 24559]|uniref:HD domain-containing protein n=1 Tax=Malaciobacter mytili LMG 24559 TaxID=1032238 RepID=A0AAX2AJW3_9BACT|nr:HD domain-containing protein [Malaciobacter mytili]AXH16423.1 hypothetical protein AMYT_a0125 [Malaciobacter mytili LMG 24559]RXK16489.1 hypothetical protein CP985_03495 [Malaciobacter mytili LMG 24559]